MSGNDDADELRSRSALARERKTDEKRLAELATALVGLSHKQLCKLELEDEIGDAVDEARRIKSHGAQARQLRVVRRALRGSDSLAIGAAVDGLFNRPATPAPGARYAQGWVDRLLGKGDQAVEDFLAQHQRADRQQLRRLVRGALKTDPKVNAKARRTLAATVQAAIRDTESDP